MTNPAKRGQPNVGPTLTLQPEVTDSRRAEIGQQTQIVLGAISRHKNQAKQDGRIDEVVAMARLSAGIEMMIRGITAQRYQEAA